MSTRILHCFLFCKHDTMLAHDNVDIPPLKTSAKQMPILDDCHARKILGIEDSGNLASIR